MPTRHSYPVRELRHKLGMRQQDFAQAMDVSIATVSKWERDLAKPSRLAIARMHGLEALVRRQERRRQKEEQGATEQPPSATTA